MMRGARLHNLCIPIYKCLVRCDSCICHSGQKQQGDLYRNVETRRECKGNVIASGHSHKPKRVHFTLPDCLHMPTQENFCFPVVKKPQDRSRAVNFLLQFFFFSRHCCLFCFRISQSLFVNFKVNHFS